jgi:hypothetical protein
MCRIGPFPGQPSLFSPFALRVVARPNPSSWRYDPDEKLWIVPDTNHTEPGRSCYCVRANGDWFKARLDGEHTQ